jgi:hypothetical protein
MRVQPKKARYSIKHLGGLSSYEIRVESTRTDDSLSEVRGHSARHGSETCMV